MKSIGVGQKAFCKLKPTLVDNLLAFLRELALGELTVIAEPSFGKFLVKVEFAFCLVLVPTKLKHATGAPVNPIAVF